MSINVLLADDSVPAQNMGKKILLDAGYTVVTVNNGLEALRKIAEAAPDVAILDIFMPGYTGLEICKRLRASAATASIPVILTVGKMEPYRPEEGESVKSNAVIVKPFAAAEMIAVVKSLIGEPSAVAATQPGPGIEFKLAAEDPPQDYLAAEGVDFPALQAANQAGVPLPPMETSQEEAADEPLFFTASSETGEAVESREPSVYSGEQILFGAASDGETSLAFDPDATHTPFSASAIDLLPTSSYSDSDHGIAAFTEFDLEPVLPSDASTPASEMPTIDGPSLAAIDSTGQTGLVDASEPEGSDAEFLVDSHEIVSGPVGAAELELSGQDVPALDPLLELPQAQVPPSMLNWTSLDVGEVSNQIVPDITATSVGSTEDVSAPAVVPPSPEEEARRAAFEALFNSDEIPPLEAIPALLSLSEPTMLPSISDLSKDYSFQIKPDAELEVLGDDGQQHFLDPGLDPNLVEEGQTEDGFPSTIGMIPERDLLLDDSLSQTGWQKIGSLQELDGTTAVTASAMDSPQADASNGLAPFSGLEAASAEALPKLYIEPANPEKTANPDEIAQAPPEAAPETPEVCPEAVLLAEAQMTEPISAPSGTEMRVAEAALVSIEAETAVLKAEPTLVPAKVEPERDEAPPVPAKAAPEKAPAEAASVEKATSQPERSPTENLASSAIMARSIEAEKVHEAVERVFERFKPLLIAAIVRELARSD